MDDYIDKEAIKERIKQYEEHGIKILPARRLFFIRKHIHRIKYKLLWIVGEY